MFGSSILEAAIGLIFVFLLVSLLVTIVNEMVAALLSSRARCLCRGLTQLIGKEWMAKIYSHPLISGAAGKGPPTVLNRGPAYMPSRSFANVLMSLVQENAAPVVACQNALRRVLDTTSTADATLELLSKQLSDQAAALQKEGGVQAMIAGDLLRHVQDATPPNPLIWLGEVDARVRQLEAANRPELTALLATLTQLVADGVNAKAGIDELRTRFGAAVQNLLASPATVVLKDELSAMGKRLQGPYTVGDFYADVQRFIDGMSARYVRQVLEALPAGDLRQTLLTLYDDASSDIGKLKENIEVWFNSGMDRVNGWYKRRVQAVVLPLSALLVVGMNVDTILIFRHLQTNTGTRDAIVEQATQFALKNPAPTPGTVTVINGQEYSGKLAVTPMDAERDVTLTSDNPVKAKLRKDKVKVLRGATEVPFTVDVNLGDVEAPATATISASDSPNTVKLALAPSLPGQFYTVQENLKALALPVGWVESGTPAERKNGQERPDSFAAARSLLLQHGLGWLLTALAASLGAPFWFDMLNRVIAIRATGKPPGEDPKPPGSVSVPVEPGQSQREADRIRQGDPARR
ncbi:hypothetical protein [Massilia sp. S19_KUP03_FR1]|uniref:hypothetical protein n=1 Tax=Massilia sp. S19_KUP03_FR1 TaxID=3025503 RepID=UPI002FCDD640